MDNQINIQAVVQRLTQQIANLTLENAILQSQIEQQQTSAAAPKVAQAETSSDFE